MNPQDTNQGAPTPAPTPVPAPEQPVAPAPVAPAPVNGGSNKKLIKLIAIIGGAVVLLAVAAVIFFSMMSVSKDDFKKSYDTAVDLRASYSDMSSAVYLSSNATETERDNAVEKLKKSKAEFDESFKKLEGEKAIQRDGEAAELFKALKEKKVKFDDAITATTEAYEYILLPISEMNEVSAMRDTSGIEKTLAAFEESKSKLQNANNKEFVEKMIPLLKEYKAAGDRYIESTTGGGRYDSSIYTQYSKVSREVSNAVRDWTSNMRKVTDNAEIRKEFNDLGEYLAEKASK